MRSINTENGDASHDQEKSSVSITHDGKSEWHAPKLKRTDINGTLNGAFADLDGDTGS